jgi:hypothetical protein
MNAVVSAAPMGAVSTRFQGHVADNDLAGGITGGYGLIAYRGKVWTIRHRGTDMQLMRDDGDGPRNSIEVVILKANPQLSKIWYEHGYVEGSTEAPDCASANGLVPDQGVPKKQNDVCLTCPKNAWGSDPRGGKGKACGDSRRLAVVPLADLKNESLGGPLLLRCPAASLQDLATFSQQMASQGYPYNSIGIRISFDPKESFPKFQFQAIRPLNDAEADIVLGWEKSAEVSRVVNAPTPQELAAASAAPAQAAPPSNTTFEQPPQQAAPQPAPAPVQQTAPVQQAQATGFGAAAPATPQGNPAPAAAPAAQPAATGFGATAPVQQTTSNAAAATAPASQTTGFGTAAPAQAAPAQTAAPAQVFENAVDGTKPMPQANAQFEASLDERLNDILGGAKPATPSPQ